MKLKETLSSALFILDCDEDFSKEKFKDILTKIKKLKKLPFHEVILTIPSKYLMKFWELNGKKVDGEWKETEMKKDQFIIKY